MIRNPCFRHVNCPGRAVRHWAAGAARRAGRPVGAPDARLGSGAVPVDSGVPFRAEWTARGVAYAAETHEGYLLWGSAPARSTGPLSMTRVEPAGFEVLSRVTDRQETTITALVRGKRVTVVIPRAVVAQLELAWAQVNGVPAERRDGALS